MVACAKVIAFFGCFVVFCLAAQKHYKNRVFDDFEMLIFSFFGQKSRVNNLAMVGSITWPSFWPKFCPERWPSYWPYFFTLFLLKLVFFSKKLILPAERRRFLKNKKQKKKQKQRWPSYWLMMAKLLTLQHIYIYICVCVSPYTLTLPTFGLEISNFKLFAISKSF